MLGTRTILGLAIDEFGIMAAEVSAHGGRPEIRHVGQVKFDDKLSSENMNERAGQLKQFLRTNRFSSKHVVIGIPLKWIVAKEMVAPAANADAVAGMLGIQAERAFSLNASELIFDFCGATSTTESSRVMLLAARRQMIEQLKGMVTAAGLHPQAVTVSALAFNGGRPAGGSAPRYGLYARPMYCEFWSQSNGRLQTIRHIPIVSSNGTDHVDLLTSAIQKQVMLLPQQEQSPPYEVTLYDASGLSGAVVDRLNKQLKPQITLTDGRSAFWSGAAASDHAADAQSVAAAAVAMTAFGAARPAVDFLNPRIGAQKVATHKKAVTWGIGVAAACVLGIGGVALDWHLKQRAIDSYRTRLEELKPQIEVAQKIVDRVTYAKPWTAQDPQFLQCLKELTLLFPQAPSSVWATSLTLNDKGGGVMAGKASTQKLASDTITAMANNPSFSKVNRNFLREAGREGYEFSVNFQYMGKKEVKGGK